MYFVFCRLYSFSPQPPGQCLVLTVISLVLKVPKRENFSLAFFALSEPTWVCDLGPGEKNRIFYKMTPDFEGLWFFAAY
jgi:hypothetical protein